MGDLELGFEENQEESVAGDGVGNGDEEGGQEFAAHKVRRLRVEWGGLGSKHGFLRKASSNRWRKFSKASRRQWCARTSLAMPTCKYVYMARTLCVHILRQ